jgi:predicted amidohydrolase
MRAAVIQLNATDDRASNLAVADRLTRSAVADGAELVLLPEKWNFLGTPAAIVAAAEPLDGPSIQWARDTARELGVEIVAGSIVEQCSDGARFNTSVHVGRDGEPRAVYRKIHLFDVEVGGTTYRESDTVQPGDEVVVSRSDADVVLGLSVCYDLRFPELYRILTLRGARVLLVPSDFTLTTTRDHWQALLRARAIENQCFVVAANQFGTSRAHTAGGRSMIVDPWGLVLAQAPDTEAATVADLDLARQDDIRRKLPSLANRRPAAYAWPEEVTV